MTEAQRRYRNSEKGKIVEARAKKKYNKRIHSEQIHNGDPVAFGRVQCPECKRQFARIEATELGFRRIPRTKFLYVCKDCDAD